MVPRRPICSAVYGTGAGVSRISFTDIRLEIQKEVEMSFTSKFKDWSSIIRDWFIIIVIICGVLFAVFSVVGDFTEASTEPPNKAQWRFTIRNTGEILYTAEYDHPNDSQYTLHGYWELEKNKYQYHDVELILDKTYFGPIKVERIVK
jgi:hypothetical protein